MKDKIVFTCFLIILFTSCKKAKHEKIDIKDKNIKEVKKAMENVIYCLQKSTFDTLKIREYIIKQNVDREIASSNSNNYDSIKGKVIKDFNFDSYKPFCKSIYLNLDKSIDINDRKFSNNLIDFNKDIQLSKELSILTFKERQVFINSFKILIKNDISSCYKVFDNFYEFRYDTGNYKGIDYECYLYLENEYIKLKKIKEVYKGRIFIEEKGNIVLCRGKRS